jgi:hypothetical protein
MGMNGAQPRLVVRLAGRWLGCAGDAGGSSMPRRLDDDESGDREWPWQEDEEAPGSTADDEDESTIPCPYCKQYIHEDAERCPRCERYISVEDSRPPRKSWWIIIGTLICLFIVYRWIVG